jgi:hypothetical protein
MAKAIRETNKSVKSIAFGEHWDSYFTVYIDGWWQCRNNPDSLNTIIEDRGRKVDLDCVSLGPNGEFYMSAKTEQGWGGISESNYARIRESNIRIKFIDFVDDNTFLYRYT